jgi:hypothetical protein
MILNHSGVTIILKDNRSLGIHPHDVVTVTTADGADEIGLGIDEYVKQEWPDEESSTLRPIFGKKDTNIDFSVNIAIKSSPRNQDGSRKDVKLTQDAFNDQVG